ncbi:hypothetical protein IMG5_186260 [Ichthyophthirius multifiliis]|uniref:Uncharacterized protein n=1 Tax=Ichthyophthirius multifiliis TaxID=5932 RepID=G0R3L8_ICHMU|nr:hypothetical protein IMG5_186260 [Ichthyophthirius multifiliis]EGR27940.1 hypothetical protein IMG5_186260 [Ichthyophthirius multifiliis]|eukprot:XP_004027285.1 hypothetical protein IMG5_186260 [Ichthyophthirius multifiliis]
MKYFKIDYNGIINKQKNIKFNKLTTKQQTLKIYKKIVLISILNIKRTRLIQKSNRSSYEQFLFLQNKYWRFGFYILYNIYRNIFFFFNRQIYTKIVCICIYKQVYDPNPPKSYMNSQRFMIALNIYQDDRNFIERPYFNITMLLGNYVREKDIYKRDKIELQLEQCTEAHWQKISKEKDFVEEYNNLGKDYLCPSMDNDIYIQGMFASTIFNFIQIVVSECKNSTSPNASNNRKWNPICAPNDLVQSKLKSKGNFGLSIFHNNYVLNVDQPQNYYTEFLNDKLYYTFIPQKMTKLSDIYFQDIVVENDESLLPFVDIQQRNFLIQENNDQHETIELERKDGKYVVATFRKSPYVTKISRQYKKLSQLMSELGGFVQIIFIVFGIFMTRYNNTNFTMDLANKLYIFEDLNKQKNEKKNQHMNLDYQKVKNKVRKVVYKITRKDPIFQQYMQKELENKQSLTEFQQIQQKSKKEYLIAQFNKILMKKDKIQLGISYYLSNLTFNLLFYSKQNQYIQKASQLMHQDLDIINILDKIQQIDKIKNILLDKDQQKIFNFNEKPKIKFKQKFDIDKMDLKNIQQILTSKVNQSKEIQQQNKSALETSQPLKRSITANINGLITQKVEFDTLDSYKKLYNSYYNLQNENTIGIKREQNIKLFYLYTFQKIINRINMRLIKGLGEQLLQIFNLSDSIRKRYSQYQNIENKNNLGKNYETLPFDDVILSKRTSNQSPQTSIQNNKQILFIKKGNNSIFYDENKSIRNSFFDVKKVNQKNETITQRNTNQIIRNVSFQNQNDIDVTDEEFQTKGNYIKNISELNYLSQKYDSKHKKFSKEVFFDVKDD